MLFFIISIGFCTIGAAENTDSNINDNINSDNSNILDFEVETENVTNENVIRAPLIEECVITAFPSLGPINSPAIMEEATFPFNINGTRYTITIPIDKNLYLAAHEGNRDVAFTGPCYSSELYELRWSTLAMQPVWNDFYASITSELERVLYSTPELAGKNLIDISEAWIQSIQYRTMNLARTLFPVEVLYERAGDCDDKGLLVTAMLAYNGYDTAIIEYSGHAVAGIGATDCDGTTGYLFLETTTPQHYTLSDIVSDPQPVVEGLEFPDWYQSAVIGSGFHDPISIRKIGNGKRTYPGCIDALYLIQEPQVSGEVAELSALAKRAAYYVTQNQYEEALVLCNEVLARDPAHADASILKALILSERYNHNEAIATVEMALSVHSDNVELRETAALVYYDAKDYERALEENTEWMALSDSGERDIRALVHRFTILVELGMYKEARETIEKLLITSPEEIEYMAQLGIQSLNMGDFKSADAQFTKVLEKVPRAIDMQFMQGLALLALDREEEARKLFHSVGEEDSGMYLRLYNQYEVPIPYFNEYESFSDEYIAFIEADPFSAQYFIARGSQERNSSEDGVIIADVPEAMRWYHRAKTADPTSSLPLLAIGALYEAEGEQIGAENAYLGAVSVDQNSTQAWYELGRFYSEAEEYEKAYANLMQGLEIDDAYASAWALLGDLYMQGVLPDSSDEQAMYAYEKALRADPSLYHVAKQLGELRGGMGSGDENATVLAAQGLTLLHQGKPEEAVVLLQRAATRDPMQGYLWLDIGRAYEALKQPKEAISAYEKALAWNVTAEAWAGLGSALVAYDDLFGAIRAYEQATEYDDSVPEYWVKRGNAEYYFGDYDAAIRSYEMSIEKGIESPDVLLLNIVETLRKAGRIEEAVEVFREVLETSPEYERWWELRFNDLIIETAYDESVEVLEVAVLLNPESGSAWNNLAVLYPRYGRLDDALSAALKATKYFGECACSWDTLGSVYLHMKQYKEAIDAYNKAIAIEMDLMEAFNNRGIAFFATQKYAEAISSLEQAAWISSDAPIGWYNLGVAYAATGQVTKANEAFSKAYTLRRDYRDLRERMLRENIEPKDQFIVADGWEGFDLIPFRTGSVS
jgi:tetratricopeptide (TPR) repeat protein